MLARKVRGDIEELKKVSQLFLPHYHHVSYNLIPVISVSLALSEVSPMSYTHSLSLLIPIPSPLTEMSEPNLRLRKRLNVEPSDHYKFMEGVQASIEHYMGVFKLSVPPYAISAPPPTAEERVNVNMDVNMTAVDNALLERIGFFTVYWKKYRYYPLIKTDMSGAPVSPPPPALGDHETQLWEAICDEHGFIHSWLAKYMYRKIGGVHELHVQRVHHIIQRVTASGEDTKRYPTVIYLPNDKTSVYDVRAGKCLENVTLFYEDNSYYHGGILVHDIFGPLRHGEGYYRDMSAKTEIHGVFGFNEVAKTLKKTEL